MANSENRRRKKIEAKRAKKKEKQQSIARFESGGVAAKLASAADWPIVESLITPNWMDAGICNVCIQRLGPHGQSAAAMFVVDLKCLGVKNALTFFGAEAEWKHQLGQQREMGMKLEPAAPEFLRKLVEGAVQFARKYGIQPHPDYARAAPIFGNLDATTCSAEIDYGDDGKPHYINGPYDKSEYIRKILDLLERNAGLGNFHSTILSGVMDDTLEFEDEGEFEDDLEDDVDLPDSMPRSIEDHARHSAQ